MDAMRNVFVAGAGGFVAGHLIRRILADKSTEWVLAVDRDRIPHGSGDQKVQCFNWDLQQGGFSISSDTVFHLASNADIARATVDPDIDFRDGTLVTRNILEAMRRGGCRRIIYFSGSGVYGEPPCENFATCSAAEVPQPFAFTEYYGPCIPTSPYGASKLASEALIAAYCHMFGMTGIVFRPANIVGPGQTHGVGYDFMRSLKKDPRSLTVMGDGTQTKSYVHIDDVLDAVFRVNEVVGPIDIAGAPNAFQVYNLASNDQITVQHIAGVACGIAGQCPVHVHFGESDRGWKGDIPKIRLNCDRLKALGWSPKYTSAQAMRASLESMA